MAGPKKSLSWTRWALVAAIALMGAALLVTVWATYASVRDASNLVLRGQSEALHLSVRVELVQLRRTLEPADLEEILDNHIDEGLRYVAFIDRFGTNRLEAGQSSLGQDALSARLSTMRKHMPVVVGDRVLTIYRLPGPPKKRHGKRMSRRLVLEFVPETAFELRAASVRTLGIGAVVAAALLLFALALVRWFVRQDALERQREHERQLASLGQMSAVLAHELRNPLASLKGNAQILARLLPKGESAQAKAEKKAERVIDEAIRLETLTNDLLDFARAGDIRPARIDPAALLEDAAMAVASGNGEADERIVIEAGEAPALWSLDRERMRQALSNLLQNAVQASDSVRASVAVENRQLIFEIQDGGDGIAPEDLPHIFEPFYTRRTRGTGLGLAVSKRLVELHGGTISASNVPEGGAVFRIAIPG